MSETLVERMARALVQAEDAWLKMPKGEWPPHRFIALAALRAIREPTEGMQRATNNLVIGFDGKFGSYNVYCDNRVATDIWEAMIDAAIAEAGGQEP